MSRSNQRFLLIFDLHPVVLRLLLEYKLLHTRFEDLLDLTVERKSFIFDLSFKNLFPKLEGILSWALHCSDVELNRSANFLYVRFSSQTFN